MSDGLNENNLLSYAHIMQERYHNYESAVVLYLELLKNQPKRCDIHFIVGLLYQEKLHDIENAIRHFQICIEIQPDFVFAHFFLGRLKEIVDKDEEQAKKHLYEVLAYSPTLLNSLIGLEHQRGTATTVMKILKKLESYSK